MSTVSSESLFNQLLNELLIEISFRAFQKHMTINSICPHCNQQYEKTGLDIYGNRIEGGGGIISQSSTTASSSSVSESSGMMTVECPCCKKVLAATRFAPHLEKCMGMGRQSARKRGNLMMKMAAGSENESDDASEASITRTPALSTTEDSFSQAASSSKPTPSTTAVSSANNEAKKVKVSPMKPKPQSSASTTPTPAASNSKSSSPSKAKRTTVTPSKVKTSGGKK